jgi:hypothetical protein
VITLRILVSVEGGSISGAMIMGLFCNYIRRDKSIRLHTKEGNILVVRGRWLRRENGKLVGI